MVLRDSYHMYNTESHGSTYIN